MPFSFPIVDDIPLGNPPLRDVICQVRFPLNLQLMQAPPAEFQGAIQACFPTLKVEWPARIEREAVQEGKPIDLRPPIYRFENEQQTSMASLSADFFSLSTSDYGSWAAFARDLVLVADAMQRIYQLSHAIRIGLRYINFIEAPRFTESGRIEDVFELIRPELTAVFRTNEIAMPVIGVSQLRTIEGQERFTMRHGIARKTQDPDTLGYVLDFDSYVEGRVGLDDLIERCDRYHGIIYNAFRWCISEEGISVFKRSAPAEEGM